MEAANSECNVYIAADRGNADRTKVEDDDVPPVEGRQQKKPAKRPHRPRRLSPEDHTQWLEERRKELLELENQHFQARPQPFQPRSLQRWFRWNWANLLTSLLSLVIGLAFVWQQGLWGDSPPLNGAIFLAIGCGQFCFCLNELCCTYTERNIWLHAKARAIVAKDWCVSFLDAQFRREFMDKVYARCRRR